MVNPRPQLIVTQPLPKAWWQSKTVWINLVVLLFNVLVLVLAEAEHKIYLLQELLPGDVFIWITFSLPIINLVLRSITTQGLSLQDPAAAMAAPSPPSAGPYRKGFEPTEPIPGPDSEGGHVV